jgi:hypothetical protein
VKGSPGRKARGTGAVPGGPGRPRKGADARPLRQAAAGGGAAGAERRWLRAAAPCALGQQLQHAGAARVRRGPEGSPALGVRPARVPSAGLHRLLLRAAASSACAGLAWAPGPQPAHATRGGPRGPWGPRSWALAGAQPPPHAVPGPGALQPPREPSAGQGGVPASGERAPAPASAAAARCPPGCKGDNRITAAGPPGVRRPRRRRPRTAPDTKPRAARRRALRAGPESAERNRKEREREGGRTPSDRVCTGEGADLGASRKTRTGGHARRPRRLRPFARDSAGGAACAGTRGNLEAPRPPGSPARAS